MESALLLAISQPRKGNRSSRKNWALTSNDQLLGTEILLLKPRRLLSEDWQAGKELEQTKSLRDPI